MKRLNLNEVIWLLILSGFYILINYLLISGRLMYLINPRMSLYIEISCLGFAVLIANQLLRIFGRGNRVKLRKGYIMFLIPLLLGAVASPRVLNTSMVEKKGVYLPRVSDPGVYAYVSEDNLSPKHKYLEQDIIKVSSSNFTDIVNDISVHSRKYVGRKITIEGFAYREKGFKKDELIVARFTMICCAADAGVIGIMAKWENTPLLSSGEWIRAEGKIKYTSPSGQNVKKSSVYPYIDIDRIIKIEKPKNEYLYH